MPAASPLPRHPGVLTWDGAVGLLTRRGCPVCHYTSEASERYLTWFALEGHSDTTTITRLTRSLGACAQHTRRLMSQPGAAARLTAVYPYLLRAARDRLAGKETPLLGCPLCDHDKDATSRALDTLLDDFADPVVRDRCAELGGLCVPHLSDAAATGHRKAVTWLIEIMTQTLITPGASLRWVAGDASHDADIRAVLGRGASGPAEPGSYVCTACLDGVWAEPARIARVVTISSEGLPDDPDLLLCASHLADAVRQTRDRPALVSLLAWQANAHIADRFARHLPSLRTGARKVAGLLRIAGHADDPKCAACRAHSAAARRALDEYRHRLRASAAARDQLPVLCVRHVLGLRTLDPWAGQVIARHSITVADMLIAELASMNARSRHRDQAISAGAAAWRRTAAFLDGNVFCGSPPHRG